MKKFIICLICLGLLISCPHPPVPPHAGDVQLIWVYISPPSDLDGFRLWYKTNLNNEWIFLCNLDKNKRETILKDFSFENKNYFGLSTFDTKGKESPILFGTNSTIIFKLL